MLGDEFYIDAHFNERRVNIEGFSGLTFSVRNLPIGVGITAVDLPGGTCLFCVSEEIIIPFKFILFTNYVCHWGLQVYILLQKYGDKQNIFIQEK